MWSLELVEAKPFTKQNENTMTMHYILSEIAEQKEKNGQKRKKYLQLIELK